jgi:hypothetical protein
LSVSEAKDGKVLLKCHAGCEVKDIVAKLGLKMSDLFPPKMPQAMGKSKRHVFPTLDEAGESVRQSAGRALRQDLVEIARHVYTDVEGTDVFVISRFEPESGGGDKTYRPFHAVDGGWRIGDPAGPLPLYGLPAIKAATGRVYVVEGEKCAGAARAIGLLSTTSSHGADAAAKTDWSPLAGRDVVILPDNDEPGAKYASDVARTVTALTPPARVKIVTLPDLRNAGDDIVDYIELHKDKPPAEITATIEALADATPDWVDDAPRAEILDAAPEVIRRPLCVIAGRGYLATWVHVRGGGEDEVKRVVLRDDGVMFADAGVPGALPLTELGATLKLELAPHFDSVMSGAALKRYVAGERVQPAEVFGRVRAIVDFYMDFGHSVGTQADLVALIALYILASYLLDAFTVIGYLWPNGDKGVGKTKLLVIVTDLGYLGVLVTAGGTFASLRDLADYGATIGFDDSESIMDVRRADPDKRTLLLAGNRKGTYVTLKEPVGDHGWTTRYVHAFCPRLFSAINLPDETLASRTIVVPLVRSADDTKANRDPADHEMWPTDRRRLIDDLWALGLANLTTLRVYDRQIPVRVPLVGRVLEPWRAVLAVALWLQEEHAVAGIFDRMSALAQHYQNERGDIEDGSPVRVLILALRRMLETAKKAIIEATPTDIATVMNQIASEDDIDHTGDAFTNARKVGRLLQRLRMDRAERTAGAKRWSISQRNLDALSRAYGMAGGECRSAVSAEAAVLRDTPPTATANGSQPVGDVEACRVADSAETAVLRDTPPTTDTNGMGADHNATESRSAVSAEPAVLLVTPSDERHTAATPAEVVAASVAEAANDLDWGAA